MTVLLFYCKTKAHKWNATFTPYDPNYLASEYKHVDDQGRRYKEGDLTAAKPGGDTSFLWRVKRFPGTKWVADLTDEWRTPKDGWEYLGVSPYAGRYWAYSKENLCEFWNSGNIIHRSTGAPRLVFYADEMPGVALQDVWADIVPPGKTERRGYPTQKPLALLERIIATSSNEGDVVLDPFAGCGTAVVASERMGRHWIGIDVTYLAINEIVDRLNEEKREGHPLIYTLEGTPKDEAAATALFQSTADQNHKPFEQWAVTLVGGKYNDKKGADRGIDGRIGLWDLDGSYREALVQVKGGNALNLSVVRDFAHVIESNNAPFGILISQREPTSEMILVAEKMGLIKWHGTREIPRMQLLTTRQILEEDAKPVLPEEHLVRSQAGVGKATVDRQLKLIED